MIDLNLLHTFCKVAELGSFTKAARYLKQPKSRISRAIGRLEAGLNLQLIRRTTRQLMLTEAGLQLFQKSHYVLNNLQYDVQQLADSRSELVGNLKVAAPEDFGLEVLSHLLPPFMTLHPGIHFELLLSNEYVDLVAQQVDVAFRIGPLENSSLIQRKLGTVKVILVASSQFLDKYGRPSATTDLGRFKLLDFQLERDDESILEEAFPDEKLVPNIKVNHFSLLRHMALHHQGIATLPDFFAYRDLKAGHLQQVLPDWSTYQIDLHLLYPPTRQMPLKIRTFIDYMAEAIQGYLKT